MRAWFGLAIGAAVSAVVMAVVLVAFLPRPKAPPEPVTTALTTAPTPEAPTERFSCRAAMPGETAGETNLLGLSPAVSSAPAEESLGRAVLPRAALAQEVSRHHTLEIPLGQGRTGHVILERRTSLGGDEEAWQWIGKLSEDPMSSVVLTAWKGTVFGTLYGAEGPLEFRQFDSDTLEVVRINVSALPDCGVQDGDAVADPDGAKQQPVADNQSGAGTRYVDVVVAYNDQARVALGGASSDPADNAAIEVKIIDAVARANLAFANSGIDMVMRLAWLGMIDYFYPVTENFLRALAEVTNANDGEADALARTKAFYQADFASLWVASNVDGGRANVLTSDAQRAMAFSVVRAQNPTDTFVHEVGHNMGCRHLRSGYTGTPSSWTPYAFAHAFTGSDGRRYTTVMASTTETGTNATRIPYFSNPSVSYESTPTGVADLQDCAKTLRDNRAVYEGFYQSPALKAKAVAASKTLTVSLANGFVKQPYELWMSADLRNPSGWSWQGRFTTDNEGNIAETVSRTGLTNGFYQWRR